MTGYLYASREDVKAALDVAETARSNVQIDEALEAGARSVDSLCHRSSFAPVLATRYFDWPSPMWPTPWRLWFDDNDLISVTTLVAGGVTIAAGDYILRPENSGPPFTYIELDRSANAAFGGGNTLQQSIALTGLWGHSDDSTPAGALAEALDASETQVDVTDSAAVGVGHLIQCGTERMQVTGKTLADTGQTVGGTGLTASMAEQLLPVASGAGFAVGETLLLDAERVRVDDIAGNNLIVKRAFDGSTLAAHTAGTAIYAPRTMTVVRGAAGTTAAAHSNGASLTRHVPPGLVRTLNIAEALVTLLQKSAGYIANSAARQETKKAQEWGSGLPDLRSQTYAAYGRKVRHRAV